MHLTKPCLFALSVLLLVSSCAQEKAATPPAAANANAIQRTDLHKAYGLPFEIKPINSMPPDVRKAAEAVVFVRNADGGSASAFFISEDGLLLTNNHVINREACTRQRCAGMQLIRDFRPGGAHELFDEFEFLAASQESDISLVKVKLPPGKKVPFLRLSGRKVEKEDSLILLGHPGGSTLHASASRLHQAKSLDAKFLSLAVGGNSGGPIVDAKSLEVVALIHAINRRDERIDREGVSYSYGLGTLMPTLEKTLKAADPTFNLANPRFTPPANPTAAQAEVAAPVSHKDALTQGRYFRQHLGTSSEVSMLSELLASLAPKTFVKEELDGLLETLVVVDLNRGKKLALTAEMLVPHQPAEYAAPNTAKVKYLGEAPEACLKEASEYSIAVEFNYIGSDCLQVTALDGSDALTVLREIFELEKSKSWGAEKEAFNQNLLTGIEYQLLLRPTLKPEDAALLKAVLKKIGTEAPLMKQYFNADRMLTLLADKPELAGPGTFRNL